ncbi:MAG: DUF4143 domain-containing protein [Thiogranum sp.]
MRTTGGAGTPILYHKVVNAQLQLVLVFATPDGHSERLGGSSSCGFQDNELKRQASWCEDDLVFFHYRDKDQYEVDLVIEQIGGKIAGVEVKAAGTVREKDFRGLKRLRQATGRQFSAGVVLYDGESVLPFGEGLFAVPVGALWQHR